MATQFWCRDNDAASLVGFMSRLDFCVATVTLSGGLKYVATEFFSVVIGLARWCRDTVFWCRVRAGLARQCCD